MFFSISKLKKSHISVSDIPVICGIALQYREPAVTVAEVKLGMLQTSIVIVWISARCISVPSIIIIIYFVLPLAKIHT